MQRLLHLQGISSKISRGVAGAEFGRDRLSKAKTLTCYGNISQAYLATIRSSLSFHQDQQQNLC
jgi:hypothetical protein